MPASCSTTLCSVPLSSLLVVVVLGGPWCKLGETGVEILL